MKLIFKLTLCSALCLGLINAQAQNLPTTTPQLAGATLHGQARLRVLVHIYDAGLYAPAGFDADAHYAQPFALTIQAGRAFKAESIMRRLVKELALQSLPEATIADYEAKLAKVMPSVEEGDALTGVYAPGKGWALWFKGQAIGSWTDDAFAKAFFNIWLGASASQTSVRRTLLRL